MTFGCIYTEVTKGYGSYHYNITLSLLNLSLYIYLNNILFNDEN